MKTKISALLIATLFFLALLVNTFGQIPSGLSYQGVARNAAGETLNTTNLEIKFGIHAGSAGGELVWEETQSTQTNEFGIFTLEIGDPDAIPGSGTLSSFSEIDWGTTQYFLNVQMKVDAAFIDMGTAEMLTVPYAMFARYAASSSTSVETSWVDGDSTVTTTQDVGIGTGTPGGKLEVVGDGWEQDEDALFQVKRKDGETVFAVYPGGVRINVDDSGVKGTKGGFAVGGFSPGKGLTNDYMFITPDSVRIYIDETVSKGTKGGFAVGGFTPGKGEPTDFVHLTPDNYFIGHQAGSSITTGLYNSFFGYQSGFSNTIGSRNVFMGYLSGYSNTSGNFNTFIGNKTGHSNITGESNVFIGDSSGYDNESGCYNVMVGTLAGVENNDGYFNIFMGDSAGYSNFDGNQNIFMGVGSGFSNISAGHNVFIGVESGRHNTEGSSGVFLGDFAGHLNTTGDGNILIGSACGYSNTTGKKNVFIGWASGYSNTSGQSNVFLGTAAGYSNDTAQWNVFIGNLAGYNNTLGNKNIFLGAESGYTNTTGENNVFLGNVAGAFNETGYRNVYVGAYSGFSSTDAVYNAFFGTSTGYNNTTGTRNTFIGNEAGYSNTTGGYNVYLGRLAGYDNTTGSYNVFIGNQAGRYEDGLSNSLIIENSNADAADALIYGDFLNDDLKFNANLTVEDDKIDDDTPAILGIHEVTIGDGIGVQGEGGYRGVYGTSSLAGGTGDRMGVRGWASGGLNNFGVVGNANSSATNAVNVGVRGLASGGTTNWAGYFDGNVYSTGSYLPSDVSLKEDIEILSGALDKVLALEGVSFKWKSGEKLSFNKTNGEKSGESGDVDTGYVLPEGEQYGVIAQDLEKILPELVKDDLYGKKSVNYIGIIPLLIESVKEQQQMIDELKAEVEALKARIE